MQDKLTDDELSSLQGFLDKPGVGDMSMDVATMEGYFAALAIGPRTVMPSQWLPWIWDMEKGEAQPPFVDANQANGLYELIFRQYNRVICDFMEAPEAFRPIYVQDPCWSALSWCQGFMLGVELNAGDWSPMLISQPAWVTPFSRLGTEEGVALTEKHGDAEVWLDQVLPSLQKIHAYWLEQRATAPEGEVEEGHLFGTHARPPRTRTMPKVGRNDPCPCGSGKKFKKCCARTSGTIH